MVVELPIRMIVEDAGANLSAHSPDLPGCVATGRTLPQLEENFREAVIMHLVGMIEDNSIKAGINGNVQRSGGVVTPSVEVPTPNAV